MQQSSAVMIVRPHPALFSSHQVYKAESNQKGDIQQPVQVEMLPQVVEVMTTMCFLKCHICCNVIYNLWRACQQFQ